MMSVENLLALPLLAPLLSAITLLFMRSIGTQRWCSLLGAVAQTAAAILLIHLVRTHGVIALHVGSWPAPAGIVLVADRLSALMVALSALTGLAIALYSLGSLDRSRERAGYYPLLHFLQVGTVGAFLAGDLFNLFVWFEVMLITSFVLLALGGERGQLEGGIKYVALNLLASSMFLSGVGLLYGATGTLNMADLALVLRASPPDRLITSISCLLMSAFAIKAAVFPLFFWLPASYHTPPIAVSALFAGLLTKVGVYALIRVFTLIFIADYAFTHTLLLLIAGLTMITGVLGAVAQTDFRRTLSFHIISQIGYMIMGLALLTPLALAGSIFYIAHHIIVKTNLFLMSGVVNALRGSYRYQSLGGVYRDHPGLSIFFLVSALSLAGVPPLSGFWGKLMLIQSGVEKEAYVTALIALVVGMLTLFSMSKIWAEVFWKAPPSERAPGLLIGRQRIFLFAPIALFTLVTVAISLSAESLVTFASETAHELLSPSAYIDRVLLTRR